MIELIFIAFSAAIINNISLSMFLGICPFLGISRRIDMALAMGIAVTGVTTISGILTFLLRHYVLLPLRVDFLESIIFIFVIAGTVQLVELYIRKFHEGIYDVFGVFLPMITTNCAVLGTCLLISMKGFDRFSQVLVYSASNGSGFLLAIVIMAGLREELDFSDIPEPLRGAPVALLAAAILAMAFMGFAGIGSGA